MRRVFVLLAILTVAIPAMAVGPVVGPDCRFSWPSSTGATGYRLYIYDTAGGFSPTADPADDITAPTLSTTCGTANLTEPGQYFAVVTAYNEDGETGPSPEAPFLLQDEPDPPPSDGLITHLPLNNTFANATGNGNTATGRSITFTSTAGSVAVGTHSAVVNASTDAIIIPTDRMRVEEGCILLWFRPTVQDANSRNVLGHTSQATSYDDRLVLRTVNGELMMRIGSSGQDTVLGDLPLNQFAHVGLSWDHGMSDGYLNGARVAQRTYSGLDTLKSYLHAGNSGTDNAAFASIGNIDDIRIYDRPCTEADVEEIYVAR